MAKSEKVIRGEFENFGFDNTASAIIQSGNLLWTGHVVRMKGDEAAKKFLRKKVDETKGRQRPRERWIDCIDKDFLYLRIRNWRSVAGDRQR